MGLQKGVLFGREEGGRSGPTTTGYRWLHDLAAAESSGRSPFSSLGFALQLDPSRLELCPLV